MLALVLALVPVLVLVLVLLPAAAVEEVAEPLAALAELAVEEAVCADELPEVSPETTPPSTLGWEPDWVDTELAL